MKIQEIYTLLFENYDQLEDTYEAALMRNSRVNGSMMHRNAINLAFRLGLMDRNDSLVIAFKNMVKKNNLHSARNPKFKDAGFWIRAIKNAGDPTNALEGFNEMILDSLEEIQKRREEKEGKGDYKVLHKGGSWVLFKVEHEAAACSLGNDTQWCISARGERNYFNQYHEINDVYMIHTKRDKYAIIINRNSREIFEVQHSGNTYNGITPHVLNEFSSNLQHDGVDIEKLEELLGVNLSMGEPEHLVEFTLKKMDSGPLESGEGTYAMYDPLYTLYDPSKKSKRVLRGESTFAEIVKPDESIYAWLPDGKGVGNPIFQHAAFGAAPFDFPDFMEDRRAFDEYISVIKRGIEDSINASSEDPTMHPKTFMQVMG